MVSVPYMYGIVLLALFSSFTAIKLNVPQAIFSQKKSQKLFLNS
jgi:hypothetical protein